MSESKEKFLKTELEETRRKLNNKAAEHSVVMWLAFAMGLCLGGLGVLIIKDETLDKTDKCEACKREERIETLENELESVKTSLKENQEEAR